MTTPLHVDASELATLLLDIWSVRGCASPIGVPELDQLTQRLAPSLSSADCADLLRRDPSSLLPKLKSEIVRLIESSFDFLPLAHSALAQFKTRDIAQLKNPLPSSHDQPPLPTYPHSTRIKPGQLLAGDIPFGRPLSLDKGVKSSLPHATRILLLGASPLGQNDLNIREEARRIDEAVHAGYYRDRFEVHVNLAARVSDIQSQIDRFRPSILHFSCHGTDQALQLQGSNGWPVQVANLSVMLSLFTDTLRCVILNSCFSLVQATQLADNICCVIGMFPRISDQAAILFSEGFYRSIANGRSIAAATEFGKARIGLEIPSEAGCPCLLATLCDPDAVLFTV